jgi:hypothetical protein
LSERCSRRKPRTKSSTYWNGRLLEWVALFIVGYFLRYLSGYGNTVKFENVGSQAGAHMLPKPFSKRTLLAVAQLLHWRRYNAEKIGPLRARNGFAESLA